jgi:hypothetical protein
LPQQAVGWEGAMMHIDFQSLEFRSEGDVESKFLIPFVTGEPYLGVPTSNFFSKDYLAGGQCGGINN